ncbi:MAG: WYL domain-containing protein [Calditrichaeota bacterium]|nr:WYL domain-containing protein [Calditrichota bacterium]
MPSSFVEMYQLIRDIHQEKTTNENKSNRLLVNAINDLFTVRIETSNHQFHFDAQSAKTINQIDSEQLTHIDFLEKLYEKETDQLRKESLQISLESVFEAVYSANKFAPAVINWAMRNRDFDTRILHVIADSIEKQITIGVSYFSLNSIETTLRKIDPYYIKTYKGQVYLIGFCHKHKTIRTFLISRIKGITETYDRFKKDASVSLQSLLKHTIGIYLGNQNPQWVKLKCSNDLLPILKAHPLHASQEISLDSNEYFSLKCQLVITDELKRLLLQFGSEIEILYPESLIDMVLEEAQEIVALYS